MTYAEFFSEVKGKFMGVDVSDIHEHLAFQFNIEDEEAGGAFYVEVKDGQLSVEPYEYYDRDAMFVCTPEVLRKISEGEMDPVWAYTTQKLRVEGNIDKALKLKDIIEIKKKEMKEAKKKAAEEKAAAEKKAAEEKAAAEKKAAEEKAAAEKKAAEEKAAAEKKAAEEKAAAEKKAAEEKVAAEKKSADAKASDTKEAEKTSKSK